MRNLLIAGASALALSACSTLPEGVQARVHQFVASDRAILETTDFIYTAANCDLDPQNYLEFRALTLAIPTYHAYKRGDLTADEAMREIRSRLPERCQVLPSDG